MTTSTSNPSELESLLRAAADSKKIPEDLRVVYSDVHGLHPGITLEVRANGEIARTACCGGAPPIASEGKIESTALMQLIELLIELEAWRQITPHRVAVPDESQAHVRIEVGDVSAGHWEWYNDMGSESRLARIRDRLKQLAKTGRGQ